MESIKKTVIEITLILSEEESRWLKELVQNPIAENESSKDTLMRQSFWEELTHQGVSV